MLKRSARAAELVKKLQTYESRNVTHVTDALPIFWESASGATVTDVDGNTFVDLTAAFGVANAGHCNPRIVTAIAGQAARLMHGMGDVHPNPLRVRLLERLPDVVPRGLSKTFLATTGSEAVEAALKTAIISTGKPRFASFRGGYHGLSLGVLPLCGIEKFREPFAGAIGRSAILLEYPEDGADTALDAAVASTRFALASAHDLAAVIVEPIQGRAGCVVPAPGFLRALRAICNELRIVMIVDEIYTGFGRTGTWFAVDDDQVVPDILCIGKAMGSGFPISAAVGRPDVMDAWPVSGGEALHASTFLGNPMACAAALATIDEMERLQLPARARRLGLALGDRLRALKPGAVQRVRGRGLFWGIQLRDAAAAARVVERALDRGVIVLQAGVDGSTIAISPPLVITEPELNRAIEVVEAAISDVA
jgi:4-aminobutyrate aminotransferase-like enzyme